MGRCSAMAEAPLGAPGAMPALGFGRVCVCKWYVLSPHWILEQLAHPGHCHTPWRAFAKD